MSLLVVLSFPLLLTAGYGLAFLLSGRNPRLLVGPVGFVLYLVLLTVPLAAVLVAQPGLPGEVLGWRKGTAAWLAAGLGGGVALWGAQLVLPGRASAGAPSRVWVGPPGRAGFAVLMVPVAYVVLAEELVWRGFLLPRLGLLLSAVAFGLHHYHFGARHVVFASLAGLAWGGLFLAAGELWPAVAAHLAYNALAWRHLRRAARPAPGPGG
jgi:membrane protease YdiL (CAAX protease family)